MSTQALLDRLDWISKADVFPESQTLNIPTPPLLFMKRPVLQVDYTLLGVLSMMVKVCD